jgi:hypothetical protein
LRDQNWADFVSSMLNSHDIPSPHSKTLPRSCPPVCWWGCASWK